MLGIPYWASEAPVVIVGCTEAARHTYIAIAFEHLVLAAANFGLGTCWLGLWDADEGVKDVLGIPGSIRILAATPLGYPAESPPAKTAETSSPNRA